MKLLLILVLLFSFISDWLIITLSLVSITWLALFVRRRLSRLYVLAEKIGGPAGCPVLGHAHLFLRKEFLVAMIEMDALYSGIARFWFGHKLVVGINHPDLYEVGNTQQACQSMNDGLPFFLSLFAFHHYFCNKQGKLGKKIGPGTSSWLIG